MKLTADTRGLTDTEAQALDALQARPLTVREVGRALKIGRDVAGQVCRSLAEHGLVAADVRVWGQGRPTEWKTIDPDAPPVMWEDAA